MSWREVTIGGYLLVVAVGVVLEILSGRSESRATSFGDLLTKAMASRPGRISVLAAWTWVGLHFFAG